MKGSIFAVLAATAVAVSCKKQETVSPALVTSTVEVMLSNPATKAAGDKFGTNAAEEFEKDVNNVTIFVYENAGTDKDVCCLVRQFTEFEMKQGKAVFTIPDVKENTKYDFYAVANCSSTNLGTKMSRPDLLKEMEGVDGTGSSSSYGALGDYNGTFASVIGAAKRTVNQGNSGFAMSGMESATTPAKGTNEPTKVSIPLRRTVAKVAVQAALDADFYKNDKYPSASKLTIKSAKLINLAKNTTLIASANPTIELRSAPLEQIPNSATVTGSPYTQYQNLFYIYENGVVGQTLADANKPELVLEAEFDFDGKPETQADISKLTYNIKLAGEAAATGAGSSPDTDAENFGLFVRNGSYLINVSIKGLTENEVVASIEIKDWETLKTQNVQIGQ